MSTPLPDPLAADASLHLLADHLADALVSGEIEPCLLHVGAVDGTGFELGVLPLEGRHPTDVLLGTSAPEDWHAVGLATRGWAYHVSERDHPGRHEHRVHLVTLLSRSGELAHRIEVDGDDAELRAGLTDQAPTGEQVDLLRRVLGLPTDPPPCDAAAYWSTEWLVSLVAGDDVPSLTAAIAHHPAMRIVQREGEDPMGDDEAADILAAFHRVATWARLRDLAADGIFTVPDLAPEEARWLDDGAFARFLLSRCPPLTLLRARLAVHVSPEVAEAVLDLLDDLGVPETTWPDLTGEPPAA